MLFRFEFVRDESGFCGLTVTAMTAAIIFCIQPNPAAAPDERELSAI